MTKHMTIILQVIAFSFLFVTMNAKADNTISKIQLPKNPSDVVDETNVKKINEIVDLANDVLDLASQRKIDQIAAKVGNKHLPVSVNLYFVPEEKNAETETIFRWIKTSFFDNDSHDKDFFDEIKRRNLPVEKVEEFRKKYFTTPESSLYISVNNNNSSTDHANFFPDLLVAQHMFGIEELIISFDGGNVSSLSLYLSQKFEDQIQIISINWNNDGDVINTDISQAYTREELQISLYP